MLSHIGQTFFIGPTLPPFLDHRIEDGPQRYAGEDSPHSILLAFFAPFARIRPGDGARERRLFHGTGISQDFQCSFLDRSCADAVGGAKVARARAAVANFMLSSMLPNPWPRRAYSNLQAKAPRKRMDF